MIFQFGGKLLFNKIKVKHISGFKLKNEDIHLTDIK